MTRTLLILALLATPALANHEPAVGESPEAQAQATELFRRFYREGSRFCAFPPGLNRMNCLRRKQSLRVAGTYCETQCKPSYNGQGTVCQTYCY